MAPVKARTAECAVEFELSGVAKVQFTVNPDGTMTGLKILPPFDKGDGFLCLRQAMKEAKFPKFKKGRVIPVEYPFVLRK